jgi:hypothetical protein
LVEVITRQMAGLHSDFAPCFAANAASGGDVEAEGCLTKIDGRAEAGDEFAIELDGEIAAIVRGDGEGGGLHAIEVFALCIAFIEHATEELEELHAAEAAKDDEIKFAVRVGGLAEEREGAAIVAAIAYEDHGA